MAVKISPSCIKDSRVRSGPSGLCSVLLNISRERGAAIPLDNIYQCLIFLTVGRRGKIISFSLWFDGPSRVSVCVCCFFPCHWAALRGAWLCLLYSSLQVFIDTDKIPLSFLFSRISTPSSLSLPLYVRCFSPLPILVVFLWTLSSSSIFPLCWDPRTGPAHQQWPPQC